MSLAFCAALFTRIGLAGRATLCILFIGFRVALLVRFAIRRTSGVFLTVFLVYGAEAAFFVLLTRRGVVFVDVGGIALLILASQAGRSGRIALVILTGQVRGKIIILLAAGHLGGTEIVLFLCGGLFLVVLAALDLALGRFGFAVLNACFFFCCRSR